jgi:hypothetical protein
MFLNIMFYGIASRLLALSDISSKMADRECWNPGRLNGRNNRTKKAKATFLYIHDCCGS